MSDLISRAETERLLREYADEVGCKRGEYELANGILKAVSYIRHNVPTAYDVEAVVEKLEENGQKMSEAKAIRPYAKHSPADHRYYKAVSVKKAIDIVRSGGKE